MLPGSPGEWWKVPVTVRVSQKKGQRAENRNKIYIND